MSKEKPSAESMQVAKAIVASAILAAAAVSLEACSFSVSGERGLVMETKSYLEEYNNGKAMEQHTLKDRKSLNKLLRKGE